ncbi:hypothetical protein FF38_02019 [Lucilia cuprina]|uniref:Uncharacterized protein n=1 Tax=Lucilia cuprina TaxID=7375 RepID=A0A0L0BM86_LUCCU|nr:hypothetical protein CVS40_9356 [Lucilia cuprina]KNC21038.1 hypothetical protein FF38_02019 [Lucilia cuprina]
MSQSQNIATENVAANYQKFAGFGDNAYKEYETIYKQMWSKLNAGHLEPFAKILMERENIALKAQEELTDTIRQNLQQQMQQALHNFWISNGVSEALISLEMCKEEFKSYEGHKWNMDDKSPWERTRPIRMRFKEKRLRYLQAQLNFQNKQLDEVMQENIALRKQIQDVKHQRIYLMESMVSFRKKIDVAKAEVIRLQDQLLTENEENIKPNIAAGNNIKL